MTRLPLHRRAHGGHPVLRPVAAGLVVLLAAVVGFLPVATASVEVAEAVAVRTVGVEPVAVVRSARRRRRVRPIPSPGARLAPLLAAVRRLVDGLAPPQPDLTGTVVLRL